MPKTTKKHFDYFKECCTIWQRKFGLTNWGIYYKHAKVDGSYADCSWSIEDSLATIRLSLNGWDDWRPLNEQELNRVALHEILHLLLASCISQAEARHTTQSAINIAEHSIIRQLEDVILGIPDAKV